MQVTALRTELFEKNTDLFQFVSAQVSDLTSSTIIVVTSKIVALAEGGVALVQDEAEKEVLIRARSTHVKKTKHVWLTVTDGMFMANAGLDESNASEGVVLLPKNSFETAAQLRTFLQEKTGHKNLGVIIVDSTTAPLRAGVTGRALGYAGFQGIQDYRGKKDLFGRPFAYSQVNVADSLAGAAVLCMGEGNEQQPLALITDAPVVFCDTINREEMRISPDDDMYASLFKNIL